MTARRHLFPAPHDVRMPLVTGAGSTFKRMVAVTCTTLSAALIFASVLPTQPFFPGDGLDVSWGWALNIAARQRLAFGRDVIFTYGPYAAVSDRMYEPALRTMTLVGSGLLAAAMAVGLAAMARPFAMLAAALLFSLINNNQAVAYGLLLPAVLLATGEPGNRGGLVLQWAAMALGVMAASMLPLIKLSFLPFSVIGCSAVCALLMERGMRKAAMTLLLVGVLSLITFWLCAGQSLFGLYDYVRRGLDVISGYDLAMSGGDTDSLLEDVIVPAVVIVLLAAWGARRLPWRRQMILTLSILATLFVAGKAGYTRQDIGHETATVCGYGLLLLILWTWLPFRPAWLALLASVVVLTGPVNVGSRGDAARVLATGLRQNMQGLWVQARYAKGLKKDYLDAVSAVPRLKWRPRGTADIYSYNQAWLFASHLPWAPRPVLQSYSAYTPWLDRLDAQHLLGEDAAQNIFFRVEPIDGRLPALEDGASWPALLSLYRPAGYDVQSDVVWLARVKTGTEVPLVIPILSDERRLGENIKLFDRGPLWVSLEVRQSLSGRVAALLTRSTPLKIQLDLEDGSHRDFRFVPGMAEAGFLLSPLVETTQDFVHLRDGAVAGAPAPPRVTAFRIEAAAGVTWAWRKRYRIKVGLIAFPAAAPMPADPRAAPVPTRLPPAAMRPTCFMDRADGALISSKPLPKQGLLTLKGWGAFDIQAGIGADAADIAFVSDDAHAWIVPADLGALDGVGAHFGHPELLRVGIFGQADVSHLPAQQYAVHFLLHRAGRVIDCATQFRVAVGARS